MDSPPPLKLPNKDSQPLPSPSPERVNGARPMSTMSPRKVTKTSDSESAFPPKNINAAQYTSARKANLFADYHPNTPSKQQSTAFGAGNGPAHSPSLAEITGLRSHTRENGDVQGLVKRFEHLEVRDRDAESVERRRKHEAELRRAQIAREEAESDVARLRAEVRRLKREADEGIERERTAGRRLEVVMEEYASSKEQHASKFAVYEKELRRSRKEAYKSSSAVIKLQEELKASRSSLRVAQSGLDLEKQKVQRGEQETFNAQYQLASVQEELEKLRAHFKVVDAENEALKTSLREEEVARVAAEGMIALPSQDDDVDLLNSPKKGCASPLSDDKENIGATPKKSFETKRLQKELLLEQIRREHAEEMVEFLSLECRFRCCSCHTAPQRSQEYSSPASGELAATWDGLMEGMRRVLAVPNALNHVENMQVDAAPALTSDMEETEQTAIPKTEGGCAQDITVEVKSTCEDDDSMTTAAEKVPERDQLNEAIREEATDDPHSTPAEGTAELEQEQLTSQSATHVPLQPPSPQTPAAHSQSTPFQHQPSIRTVTTTTTIPMHFTPVSKPHVLDDIQDAENIPPVVESAQEPAAFDRAAALAAIEYRRGRAKSFAAGHLTPRKQMLEGTDLKGRRDISAPALGAKASERPSSAKVANSVGRSGGRKLW